MDEPAAPEPFDEPLYAQSLAAFRNPAPMSVPALVTALLVIAFAASSFGQLNSWTAMLTLVAVVAFHEAGHAFGMRVFGFRDVKMFFIPFFGAAVVGRPRGAAPWKDALVSLLGPLPGLLLAVVIFATGLRARQPFEWPFHVAESLLLLNAFNLLPLGFLDGGRFFQRTIFARHRVLAVAFDLLGALALGALAVTFKMWLLGFFVLMSLRGLPRRWRVLGGAAAFRSARPEAFADPERLADEDARVLFAESRAAVGPPANESAGAIAGAMEEMLDASQRAPGVFATIGLLLLYALAVVCTFAGIFFHVSGMGAETWRWVRTGEARVEFPRDVYGIAGAAGGTASDTTWRATLNGVERFTVEKLASDTSAAAVEKRVAALAHDSGLEMKRSQVIEGEQPSDSLVGMEYRFRGERRELRARTFVVGGRRYWVTASAPKFGERASRFLESFRRDDGVPPVVPR
ncbi:MAG: hypothetical protein HZA61_00575 [Candidatus Eisenbacteria bacterium]|uniref:Peptidase M50 domain-containing protein n=1 Tax=Eiseniibacteriota bacterium TaxID=2212470 RepID=A0A933SA22_UNCEI|nr:hypothetical protein [Candidatus Eisenbacteria bacterium]